MGVDVKAESVSLTEAILVTAAVIIFMGVLRLYYLSERLVPLADGLPLFICLWHKRKSLLLIMASVFTLFVFYKVFLLLGTDPFYVPFQAFTVAMLLLNIWVATIMIFLVLKKEESLVNQNSLLIDANHQLAVREEELIQQNEELHSQAEELEQQAEELRQQSEELESHAENLQTLHSEVERRESALESLLSSTGWQEGDSEATIIEQICKTATQLLGDNAKAAAIFEKNGALLTLRGKYGFELDGAEKKELSFPQSMAALVIERGQTAYIKDVSLRPDLDVLQPAMKARFSSVLASPIKIDSEYVAAIEVFSDQNQEWSKEQFRLIEWIAHQSSVVLQASRLRTALEKRSVEAEEASMRKTTFLAAVSHDVRTPVNAINLCADVILRAIKNPKLAEKLPEFANSLKVSTRSLAELVTDVLELVRFDSGQLTTQLTRFSLVELLATEVKQLEPLAEEKGLQIIFEPPTHSVFLQTDKFKLARIIGNILGNGIKFTETGHVRLAIHNDEEAGVSISISDTGVGIPAEILPRIFDEFFQLRNPERDRNKGSGLGLAICKRLVDSIGCVLSVESAPQKGTKFTIQIPRSMIALESVSKKTAQTVSENLDYPSGDLAGMVVLVVEDHGHTRAATTTLLASEGALVIQAETGRQALHGLHHDAPHAVVLDLMLPDLHGIEILKEIKKRRPASLRTVVVVSGVLNAQRNAELKELGADLVLSKPIRIETLTTHLSQFDCRRLIEDKYVQ